MMRPARQARPISLILDEGVAGIDEAGRGPLAGPLVVAAVLLDPRRPIPGLDDSKKLTASRRDELFARIMAEGEAVSLVFMSTDDIAALNIRGATLAGMRRAAHALQARRPVPRAGVPEAVRRVHGVCMGHGDRRVARQQVFAGRTVLMRSDSRAIPKKIMFKVESEMLDWLPHAHAVQPY